MKTIVVNNNKINFAPQQKLIIINKQTNSVNFEYMKKAMKSLSLAGFELYMYLYAIEKNKVWALSSQFMYDNSKLTKRLYTSAVNELIDMGYLVHGRLKTDDGIVISANVYDFFESPNVSHTTT